MVIGAQASGALVLATRHGAPGPKTRVWGERRVPRQVVLVVLSTAYRAFFPILKQGWDFYHFSTSLLISVLLPFYVKSAELLHYPHPMPYALWSCRCRFANLLYADNDTVPQDLRILKKSRDPAHSVGRTI